MPRRAAAVILVGLVAVACGSVYRPVSVSSPGESSGSRVLSSPTPWTSPSPAVASSARQSPPPCPTGQPAARFQASTSATRNLALVKLQGSTKIAVRDITDIEHPTTVGQFDEQSLALGQFVSASEVSYAAFPYLVRTQFSGSPVKVAAQTCNGIFAFAWSPDGTAAAYIDDDRSSDAAYLHLVRGGEDRVVSSMPHWPITGCEAQWECLDSSSVRLLYSPDGKYISFVQWWGGPSLRIWTADGSTLMSIDRESETMSVWSGSTLYWRDSSGVESWHDGRESLALPGVKWIRPSASPAGGAVVYAARDGVGVPHVYRFDTASRVTTEIASFRNQPVFLTSRYIWYEEERLCAQSDQCGSAATMPTGNTYIYDLQTGTEARSIITAVGDVWPHPA